MQKYDLSEVLKRGVRTPSSFLGLSIDYIESRLDDEILPDPVHPLIQLVEATSAHTVFAINEGEVGDRRAYPLLANVSEDLYGWMNESDHLLFHSQPGTCEFKLYFPRDELIRAMRPIPGSSIKRAIIPRYSTITVNNLYSFILLYPIEIRLLPYGKGGMLQIVYNTDKKTSVQIIGDNVLPWNIMLDQNRRQLVEIPVKLLQLSRITNDKSILDGTETKFSEPLSQEEKYHYCRVFHSDDKKNWIEINTTYDEIVRDIYKPTAVVRASQSLVEIYIPAIYKRSNQIKPNIRYDIYTTKGDITIPFNLLRDGDFSMKFGTDIDDPDLDYYSGGVPAVSKTITSDDTLRGGSNQMEFEKLREMIIYNSATLNGDNETTPITPVQLYSAIQLRGFDIIQVGDDLTNREYYATKTLRSYGVDNYLSIREEERPVIFNNAIASGIARMQTNMKELVKYPGVHDNGDRITITPKTLFDYSSGQLAPLPSDKYPNVVSNNTETIINLINSQKLVFTPFYYVLDANGHNFDLRAYYIDKPKILRRRFEHENVTAEREVSTLAYEFIRVDTGYQLILQSQVGESYKELDVDDLSVQLLFHPSNDSTIAHIAGKLLSIDESGPDTYYYWLFDIKTDYDFEKDGIVITNGMIREAVERDILVDLSTEFTIVYGVSNNKPVNYQPGPIDGLIAGFLMGDDPIGIISENIDVELGRALNTLAKPHITLGGSKTFLLYSEDVYGKYEHDVYELDSDGKRKFVIENGAVKYTYLHRKGDPKLDSNGNPIIIHEKGTTQLDENGQPIVISERQTTRFIDMFVMDGIYYYANDTISINEREYIPEQIVYQFLDSLEPLTRRRLESTSILLYPKKTIGHIKVIVDEGRQVMIDSQMTFKIKALLNETVSNNPEYKTGLERLINDIINTELKERTVSTTNMIAKVRNRADENLIGLEIHMLSSGEEFFTFTAVDDSVRPTIKRIARLGDDGRVTVREDIAFDAREHTLNRD